METRHCPYCDSTNLTQEGINPTLVKYGYWKCLDCGRTGKPIVVVPAMAAEAPADQPPA